MEFYEIQYFCTVCETGSISKAANVVHISQPALSQSIKKMEKELRANLFLRSSRPLVLTEVGKLVYLYGKQILDLKANLDGAISEVIHSDEVEIKVGMSPFYSKHYLPSVLSIIHEQFPNIRLTIVEDISDNQEKMLLSGDLDFCCLPQEPEVVGLSYETICMEEILLAVPGNSTLNQYAIPASPLPFLDLKHLDGQKMVTLKSVQKINSLLHPIFEASALKFQIVYETLDWDTVNIMIGNGMGIGFVPDVLFKSPEEESIPRYYRVIEKGFHRRYSIAYKSDKVFTPLERHLISVFKSSIQEQRANVIN